MTPLGTVCSSVYQVQGERDLAACFHPIRNGYCAVLPLRRGMGSHPKIPRAWWPTIAQEYAAGMSGPKLAKKYGVGSTQPVFLMLQKCRQEQTQQ